MSRLIIGITGEIKAGKGMVEGHLKSRYDCDYTRFSAPLARSLDALGLPHTRENLQDISTLLRRGLGEVPPDGAFARLLQDAFTEKTDGAAFCAMMAKALGVFHIPVSGPVDAEDFEIALHGGFGEDILAKTIAKDCEKATKECMIVDGVRRMADIVMLRALPNFHLFYITAPFEKRLEWAIAAAEKVGDAGLTPEKFRAQNDAEAEREIPIVGATAHLRIDNVGSKEDALRAIDKYLTKIDPEPVDYSSGA